MHIVLDGNTAFEYWMCATQRDETMLVHATNPPLSSFDQTWSSKISEGIRNQGGSTGGIEILVGSKDERRYSDFVSCGMWSARTPIPPDSLYMVGPGIYVESPELCLLRLASMLERPVFLRALSDMLGVFGFSYLDRMELVSREPLTTISKIQKFVEHIGGAYGVNKLRSALSWVIERSGSPRETSMNLCMSMPSRLGGQQLPRFEANYHYDLTDEAKLLTRRNFLVGDASWPEKDIEMEYNSNKHHDTEEELEMDFEKITALESMGVTVIPVSTRQFNSYDAFSAIMSTVRERLGMSTAVSEAVDARRRTMHERLLRIERSQRELPSLGETARWQYLAPRLDSWE